MALVIQCNSCRQKFKIPEKAATRIDLEQMMGEYFRKTCLHCCIEQEYHVNDVMEENSHIGKVISSLVGISIIILVTFFAWGKGVITNVGLIIGGAILVTGWKVGSSPSSFNSYRTIRSRDVAKNRQFREETKYTKGDSNFKN